jgi:hypothetical protein
VLPRIQGGSILHVDENTVCAGAECGPVAARTRSKAQAPSQAMASMIEACPAAGLDAAHVQAQEAQAAQDTEEAHAAQPSGDAQEAQDAQPGQSMPRFSWMLIPRPGTPSPGAGVSSVPPPTLGVSGQGISIQENGTSETRARPQFAHFGHLLLALGLRPIDTPDPSPRKACLVGKRATLAARVDVKHRSENRGWSLLGSTGNTGLHIHNLLPARAHWKPQNQIFRMLSSCNRRGIQQGLAH